MTTVNIDLDGVVYPFHEIMAMYSWQKTGDENLKEYDWDWAKGMPFPEPKAWDFLHTWNLTAKQFDGLFRRGVEEGVVWSKGNPLKGAVEGMWELDAAGCYIRIVTHRLVHKNLHAVAQIATAQWLEEWNIPYHEIVYVGNGAAKADVRADFALDDKPMNVMNWNMQETADAYLLDRPWNRDFETDNRLYDWRSFVDIAVGTYDGLETWEVDSDEELPTESPDTSEVGTDN